MKGIEACQVFILVFSKQANDSDHVYREVTKAFSSRLVVVPFRIEAVLPTSGISYYLNTVQGVSAVWEGIVYRTLSRRDEMMVARQELPGIGITQDPSRRARFDTSSSNIGRAWVQLTVSPSSRRSLRDGTVVVWVPKRFLPGYHHSVPPGRSIVTTRLYPLAYEQKLAP